MVGNKEDRFSHGAAQMKSTLSIGCTAVYSSQLSKTTTGNQSEMSLGTRKLSDKVRLKLCCTATVDGQRLEILDLESRGILLCREIKSADQLPGYHAADLCHCFHLCKK